LYLKANSLSAKLRAAIPAELTARHVFEGLDEAINSERRDEWTAQERSAMEQRVRDPTAMDIFQMRGRKGEKIQNR
jgi:hypothetical protein